MTTAHDLAALVGKHGSLTTTDGLKVAVKVLDARQAFGRVDLLVVVASGGGEYKWVNSKRVRLEGSV